MRSNTEMRGEGSRRLIIRIIASPVLIGKVVATPLIIGIIT